MSQSARLFALVVLGLCSAAAEGAEPRDFCPDRPGLDTPACTMDKGRIDVELGIANWTSDRRSGVRTQSLSVGEMLLRYGLGDSSELQIGWDGFGVQHVRSADDETFSGGGDVRLAVRQNLRNPDGSGLSLAIMPFLTLPVGKAPIGNASFTGGVIVPVSYALPNRYQLAFTAELDAAADEGISGHHIAYGGTIGLVVPLGENLTGAIELQDFHDQDPSGASEQRLAAISVAWLHGSSLQIDVGSVFGASHAAPDLEFYAGVSRRF